MNGQTDGRIAPSDKNKLLKIRPWHHSELLTATRWLCKWLSHIYFCPILPGVTMKITDTTRHRKIRWHHSELRLNCHLMAL